MSKEIEAIQEAREVVKTAWLASPDRSPIESKLKRIQQYLEDVLSVRCILTENALKNS
jgi:hypothetical protein